MRILYLSQKLIHRSCFSCNTLLITCFFYEVFSLFFHGCNQSCNFIERVQLTTFVLDCFEFFSLDPLVFLVLLMLFKLLFNLLIERFLGSPQLKSLLTTHYFGSANINVGTSSVKRNHITDLEDFRKCLITLSNNFMHFNRCTLV